jgi:hypothetical protein
MIKVFDFFFYCFYCLAPEKALFGRQNVAMTLLAVLQSYLLIMLMSIFYTFFFRFPATWLSVVMVILVFITGTFYWTIKYFERPGKIDMILKGFGEEKFFHKGVAILSIIAVLYSFVEILDYLSAAIRNP